MDATIRNYKDYPLAVKNSRKKQLSLFYNANFPLSQWSQNYFSAFLDDENERRMLCLVLEKNSKILGFILGRAVGNINNRYNITTLLIDEDQRGKKYGQFLLNKFLKTLRKDKSVKKAYLHFRDSNNLESFYNHCGFRKHRIAGYYSNGERKHYMEINAH